jgi:hypothetical protein
MQAFIDWWLSPELYLRRPPARYPEWRIDRVLKRKAEQGVKVYVLIYKEVTQGMNMSSRHTKNHLQETHPNIAVIVCLPVPEADRKEALITCSATPTISAPETRRKSGPITRKSLS